ncbi:MAG: DUF4373 domain-containing protein [Bacteroides sp.]|nr:DUF4373 domain-containing protein [Bacteroides sp.]
MSTKGEYFPLEVAVLTDERVLKMIEKHKAKGFGTYLFLLTELRMHQDYTMGMTALRTISRARRISMKSLESIIYDFDLFVIEGEGENLQISSEYMQRVMSALEENRKKRVKAGKKGAASVGRDSTGKFTGIDGAEEKRIEEKRREENSREIIKETGAAAVDNSYSHFPEVDLTANPVVTSWEKHLDEAIQDESWVEVLAIHSQLGCMFTRYFKEIVEEFRRHIKLKSKGRALHSVADVKDYFSNFLNPGTDIHRRLLSHFALLEEEERRRKKNIFEMIDSKTGQRTYCGIIIPPDAPPRPSETADWSHEQNCWVA